MRPSVATSLRQAEPMENGISASATRSAISDSMAANRSVQLRGDADATHENARKGWIDPFEIERLVCDQVHRQSEEEMRADRRESHNHEVPLSHRLGELMSVVQADDPDTVARDPFPPSPRHPSVDAARRNSAASGTSVEGRCRS